jgi:hypothetical protein
MKNLITDKQSKQLKQAVEVIINVLGAHLTEEADDCDECRRDLFVLLMDLQNLTACDYENCDECFARLDAQEAEDEVALGHRKDKL